jgi:hypothetical protein
MYSKFFIGIYFRTNGADVFIQQACARSANIELFSRFWNVFMLWLLCYLTTCFQYNYFMFRWARYGAGIAQLLQRLAPGWTSRGRVKNSLFSASSRPTQPPIQWVPRALSPRVKRPVREVDHWPPASAQVKKTWVYNIHSRIRLYGVVLN